MNDNDLISGFLRGELSENEEKNFFEKVNLDKDFKERFLFQKELFETFNEDDWNYIEKFDTTEVKNYASIYESKQIKQLERTIKKVSGEYKKNSPKTKVYFLLSSVAAAILLFIFLQTPFFQSGFSTDELYNQYLSPEDLPTIVVRGDININDKKNQAEKYFREQNYRKAVTLFDEVLLKDKNNSNIYILNAVSNIELKKYKKAEKTLNDLINSDLIDAEKGYWYKALLFIKSKEIVKAQKELSTIVKKSYFNYKEAEELLKKLK